MQWRFLTENEKQRMEELFCLEIVEKMNRFALLNFKIFWGAMPPDPILWRGYGAPSQTPPLVTPALRASVPRSEPSA